MCNASNAPRLLKRYGCVSNELRRWGRGSFAAPRSLTEMKHPKKIRANFERRQENETEY
jgi:hypothetical protein